MNTFTLQGYLAEDPKLKISAKQVPYMNFFIYASTYKNEKKYTTSVPVAAFYQTAESIAKHFHKGSEILLEGRLHNDSYTDKNGEQRGGLKVIVDRIKFPEVKNNSTEEKTNDTSAVSSTITTDSVSNNLLCSETETNEKAETTETEGCIFF